MGVIKVNDNNRTPERIEDNLDDYLLESSDDDERVIPIPQSLPATPRRRRRRSSGLKATFPAVNVTVQPKRGMGAKKQRRFENTRLLSIAALVDPEDICEDLSDMLPAAITAFTQLFLEKENMALWNDFIEKSEEEQREILDNGGNSKKNEGGHVLGGRGFGQQRTDKSGDSRSAHPAYSAESCFRRIDGHFRSLLAKKHLPWGTLERFESELADFFLAVPDGVWVQAIEHGFNRLLLHAVAQYLSLKSQSYNSEVGQRQTQIENRRPFFVPPRESLVSYLQRRSSIR